MGILVLQQDRQGLCVLRTERLAMAALTILLQAAGRWQNACAERTPPGKKTTPFLSTGAQYGAPTSQEGTAMKLGPGPKGA